MSFDHGVRRGRTSREYAWLYRGIAFTDALCSTVALYTAAGGGSASTIPWPLILASPVVVWIAFPWLRLYQTHLLSPAEEFRRTILGVTLTNVAMVSLSFFADLPFPRLWAVSSLALSLVLMLASRRFWRWAVFRERVRRGRYTSRTAIVGTNDEAVRLAQVLDRSPLGFRPVGFVAAGDAPRSDVLPLIGSVRRLRLSISSHAVESIFVAASGISQEDMGLVQRAARRTGVDVHVTANLPQLLASRIAVEPLGGIMALSVRPVRLTGPQAAGKRVFDVVLAGVALLVSWPIWVLAAALVKATSPGPVFFRQERVGCRNRPFMLLKFRTMCSNAEEMLSEVRHLNEADGPLFKMRNDPRVTSVGKWLRKTSIDELPQLLNVLRGDMSLVGPRPPLQSEVDAYEEWQRDRLEVRPGITGVWQVSGRSNLTFEDYVRLDLFYIENWCLSFDVYLIVKTIPAVLRGRGAS